MSKIYGADDLEEFLDQKITCLLKDNRYLEGTLRSYDKFNNLTIENTKQKIIYNGMIAFEDLGVFIIRGENIVMFGTCNEKNFKENLLIKTTVEEISLLKGEELN